MGAYLTFRGGGQSDTLTFRGGGRSGTLTFRGAGRSGTLTFRGAGRSDTRVQRAHAMRPYRDDRCVEECSETPSSRALKRPAKGDVVATKSPTRGDSFQWVGYELRGERRRD